MNESRIRLSLIAIRTNVNRLDLIECVIKF